MFAPPSFDTRIGVGVLCFRGTRVLLGERLNAHGSGTWSPPGGHMEAGETVEGCATRELLEETGVLARQMQRGPYSVDDFPEIRRRYATLFVIATQLTGDPMVCEPEKCGGWRWVEWSDLAAGIVGPLFRPLSSLVLSGWSPPPEQL